ncbi:O-antigen polymerase [Caldithrix abyssi DSM 13497]|uniref:O-antigen ligase n=1 Tax=Caldithrix abyssi DSM 13497 TaxID=880073 RepID=H1XWL1_CALAY|nr:O-antigen ligase family protein [Caldithrix abyssi]APF17773.1 O-antigen ligase [Caldithrix abyssi DSM 13497]EHO41849.1 O-antigen polymerase [Caldithrix abyssi DSM 13497]
MNVLHFHINKAIMLAGFIWGLSGFTIEIVGGEPGFFDFFIRFLFMIIACTIIYTKIKIQIKKEYLPAILFLLIFLTSFLLTLIINKASIIFLIREILLIFTAFTIIVLLNDGQNIQAFLRGIFYALNLLVFYYFINIEFSNFLSPLYRLYTKLNPNGIGIAAVMLFVISLYSFYSTRVKFEKYFLFVSILLSFVVVLATRSRTSMIMMLLAFFSLSFFFKKKRILIVSSLISIIFIIYNFETLSLIIRLESPPGFSGPENISNLTGRTLLWKKGFNVFLENFFLGVGPERAKVKVINHMSHYHNAYIQLMVVGGIFTFLPIFILVINAIKNLILYKVDTLFKVIFVVGLVSSMVENRLLNFGSPGNFLFLIAFLTLNFSPGLKKTGILQK